MYIDQKAVCVRRGPHTTPFHPI
uniref:Uncharacterized protein n=1 Tax=Anguilla anguilla TaxID=7936 RepID=A0A0E9VTM6_ANGAN